MCNMTIKGLFPFKVGSDRWTSTYQISDMQICKMHTELEKHWESADLRLGRQYCNQWQRTDHPHNVISCSWSHCGHFLKISSKSIHNFSNYVANRQTDRQTNSGENITSLAEVIMNRPTWQIANVLFGWHNTLCWPFLFLIILDVMVPHEISVSMFHTWCFHFLKI